MTGQMATALGVVGLYGRARVGLKTDARFESIRDDVAEALVEQGYAETVDGAAVRIGGEVTLTTKGREATGR